MNSICILLYTSAKIYDIYTLSWVNLMLKLLSVIWAHNRDTSVDCLEKDLRKNFIKKKLKKEKQSWSKASLVFNTTIIHGFRF